MLKASKSQVDYSRGHLGRHCGKAFDDDGYCKYFIEPRSPLVTDLGTREKVQAEISGVVYLVRRKTMRERYGDRVQVEMTPYDLTKGGIIYRVR